MISFSDSAQSSDQHQQRLSGERDPTSTERYHRTRSVPRSCTLDILNAHILLEEVLSASFPTRREETTTVEEKYESRPFCADHR